MNWKCSQRWPHCLHARIHPINNSLYFNQGQAHEVLSPEYSYTLNVVKEKLIKEVCERSLARK